MSHHLWQCRVGLGLPLLWRALLTVTQRDIFRLRGSWPSTSSHSLVPSAPSCGSRRWKVLGTLGPAVPPTRPALGCQQTTGKPSSWAVPGNKMHLCKMTSPPSWGYGFLKCLPRWCPRTLPMSFSGVRGECDRVGRIFQGKMKRRNPHLGSLWLEEENAEGNSRCRGRRTEVEMAHLRCCGL